MFHVPLLTRHLDCLNRTAPTIHDKYEEYLTALEVHYEKPLRNWKSSSFAAATFNFGPRVVTLPHRDSQNYAGGLCSITAFGKYDHTRVGHLLVWPLKIAIEFPPGATILIPSALFMHSNIPVRKHETRRSITQFTAGGIFRFVDNGFRTVDQFKEDATDFEKEMAKERLRRCIHDMLDDMPILDVD